jgi:glycogen debranching enzyme
VLLENGLLLSLPSHAWMNGKRTVWAEGITVTDLPIRVPNSWQVQDLLQLRDSHYTWDNYQYPTFYLPEVNAYWLKALKVAEGLAERFEDAELGEEIQQVRQMARLRYKGIFWNAQAHNLYNLVTLEHRTDGTFSAAAVEAAALLGETVFSRQELEYIWVAARNKLLAKRLIAGDMAAFGLVAKDSTERVFYNNQQYHEAVIWPRVTPYLIRLLRMLGQQATVQELLKTNLGHQMEEAAVFYNNEMLSLPEGENPFPDAETERNPVPVKNPIQWWSQWCDPYMGVEGIQ